jgi:hypothetical protein
MNTNRIRNVTARHIVSTMFLEMCPQSRFETVVLSQSETRGAHADIELWSSTREGAEENHARALAATLEVEADEALRAQCDGLISLLCG